MVHYSSMVLKLLIPRKPLTVNHIYGQTRFGRKFLKPEAVQFKKEVELLMRGKFLPYNENKHFIKTKFYFGLSNFWTAKGLINKKSGDTDNFKKLLQDSIFDFLGINDAVICRTVDDKFYAKEDFTGVLLQLGDLAELKSNQITAQSFLSLQTDNIIL